MVRIEPTQRQRRVLESIRAFWEDNGYPPTVRDIADGLDLSVSTVQYHLARLEESGGILCDANVARSIRLGSTAYNGHATAYTVDPAGNSNGEMTMSTTALAYDVDIDVEDELVANCRRLLCAIFAQLRRDLDSGSRQRMHDAIEFLRSPVAGEIAEELGRDHRDPARLAELYDLHYRWLCHPCHRPPRGLRRRRERVRKRGYGWRGRGCDDS